MIKRTKMSFAVAAVVAAGCLDPEPGRMVAPRSRIQDLQEENLKRRRGGKRRSRRVR